LFKSNSVDRGHGDVPYARLHIAFGNVCFFASDLDHFPRRIPILEKDAKGVFSALCVLVALERHLSACQEWQERSEGHPRSGREAKAERSCTGIAKDGVMKLF
jgi:hypothetical protein